MNVPKFKNYILVLILFLTGCASISKEEKLAATKQLLNKVVKATLDKNEEKFNSAFLDYQNKYGEDVYVPCENNSDKICTYYLNNVEQSARQGLFNQTKQCDEDIKKRRFEVNFRTGFQFCTSAYLKPFNNYESLKVDLSPITKIYDLAEKNEKDLRAKDAVAKLQKQKEDEAEEIRNEKAEQVERIRRENDPKEISENICSNQAIINLYKSQLKQERKAAAISGVVDMRAVNNAGKAIVFMQEQIKPMLNKYKKVTGKTFDLKKCN